MQVLNAAHQAEFRVREGCNPSDHVFEPVQRFKFRKNRSRGVVHAASGDFSVSVEVRENRSDFWIPVVGDGDEFGGHSGIDVHLRVAHVGDKFHTNVLHLVVHEVAGTVARVSGKNDPGGGRRFNFVHHFQRLHFQPFWNLEGDQLEVVGFDSLDQFVQFEIVPAQIHCFTTCTLRLSHGSPWSPVRPLLDESTH